MESTRSFIAVDATQEARDTLAGLQAKLNPILQSARWVRREQIHLTIAFLGDVETARQANLITRLQEAVGSIEPFCLRLAGVGAFPDASRPRVLWAGLAGTGLERLEALQHAVVKAARNAHCPPADDRFSPHLTLARFHTRRPARLKPPPPALGAALSSFKSWDGGELPVRHVTLYASLLERDGPGYQPLCQVPLGLMTCES